MKSKLFLLLVITLISTFVAGSAGAVGIGPVPPTLAGALDLASVVIIVDKGWDGRTAQDRRQINPNSTLQTATIYVKREQRGRYDVSTGAEVTMQPVEGGAYFATTPIGAYSPDILYPSVYSISWKVPLNNAIFFNGGIALHAALPQKEVKLGKRDSGGCIRLLEARSRELYELVLSAGRNCSPINAFGTTGTQCASYDVAIIVYDSTQQSLR